MFGSAQLLTPLIFEKDLRNSTSPIHNAMVFLYSMETFLPYALNKACREKDESKIETLGPFAVALSYILRFSQAERRIGNELRGKFRVYRGVKLP